MTWYSISCMGIELWVSPTWTIRAAIISSIIRSNATGRPVRLERTSPGPISMTLSLSAGSPILRVSVRSGLSAGAPAGAPADKPDLTLTLKIGDPALKDKVMEIGPGDVLSSRTGRPVAFERMIDEMMAARIVHVGETHNSMPMHEIEYQVIRALYARDKHLAIGLEMVPVTLQ